MVNAVEDITIFNLRYDSSTRREVFIATNISGVSLYHAVGVSSSGIQGGDNREESITYKIRIPISAKIEQSREYIDEADYAKLSDDDALNYWTLQKGCYILMGQLYISGKWLWDEFNFQTGVSTKEELEEIQALREYNGEFITVLEYADNTRRGSDSVKHWRIGGA